MRRLGPTVARLHALRRGAVATTAPGKLTELTRFGANPGALAGWTYVPDTLSPGAALVVVLHGCTQNAALYDRGSGWSDLADRHGFAVLYPEQTRANNPNLCFNWYATADAARGRGEAASIAQMIRHLVARHDLDPRRVHINGLSAGGAMTAVMLACYPDLFAGGAIIAGLPYAVAEGVPEALERMRGQGMPSRSALATRLADATDYAGPWPTLSVWHGTADHVVSIANAGAIVDQWRDHIGLADTTAERDTVNGQSRTVWRDAAGRGMVERIDIAGLGHGTPLAARGGCGRPGPHMLEAGICSTSHLAAAWDLIDQRASRPAAPAPKPAPSALRDRRAVPRATSVGAVIEDALRAAGLMR